MNAADKRGLGVAPGLPSLPRGGLCSRSSRQEEPGRKPAPGAELRAGFAPLLLTLLDLMEKQAADNQEGKISIWSQSI